MNLGHKLSYKLMKIIAHLIEVDWAGCKQPANSNIIELHLKQTHNPGVSAGMHEILIL